MPRKNVSDAAPAIPDWTRADAALSLIADLNVRIARREAEKSAALSALQEAHDANIKPLLIQRDALDAAIRRFAEDHAGDLAPASGRSRQRRVNHGVIGLRLGQRALKTLAKWTWDRVLAVLQARRLSEFIRVKEDVDRAAILASDLTSPQLRDLGLQIVQEERAYYELRDSETVNPEAAA